MHEHEPTVFCAQVGKPSGPPEESTAGIWSRRYSTGYVLVNPWADRGTLSAPPLPPPSAGHEWQDLYNKAVVQPIRLKPVTAITLVLRAKVEV